jgi:hypothetical protein
MSEQTCKACGCTEDRACVTDGVACRWVKPGFCSVCYDKALNQLRINATRTVKFNLPVPVAFSLVAVIQLACRHPEFQGQTRDLMEGMAREIADVVAKRGPLKALMEAGWGPEEDHPRDPRTRIIIP